MGREMEFPMRVKNKPPCARCKTNENVLLAYTASKYPASLREWPGDLVATRETYRCTCGHIFTIVTQHGAYQRQAAEKVR